MLIVPLEQKSADLTHSTLLEIKDFNALSDASCCRSNRFRSRSFQTRTSIVRAKQPFV